MISLNMYTRYNKIVCHFDLLFNPLMIALDYISRVSCQKGPTRHAYAWQIGPFWQDTLDMSITRCDSFVVHSVISHVDTFNQCLSSEMEVMLKIM